MLPWTFSEEAAAEKRMAQLQHNMWVTASRTAVLSIITGGGKWVEITIPADPLYQHLLLTAEKKFWRCVETGETPHLFGVEPPRPRIEAVRVADMSFSNAWAEFAGSFRLTRAAFLEHEKTKAELKSLMPEDAKEAIGHGVRARRSKSGAVSFDLHDWEGPLCSSAMKPLAPSQGRWLRPTPRSPILKSRSPRPSGLHFRARATAASAIPHYPPGLIWSAKASADMERLPRFRRPRSTHRPG
jgi:hypothetical protein